MERRFEIWTAYDTEHSPETPIFTFSFIERWKVKTIFEQNRYRYRTR